MAPPSNPAPRMGSHGRSSEQKREKSSRKRSHDSESDSGNSDSRDSSPSPRSRKRRESSSRRRDSGGYSSDDSYDSGDGARKVTEEEISEYLAKKAQKRALRVAKKLKSQSTVSGYSNDSNPFGDSNLNEKFVWRKKIERDVTHGVSLDEFSMKSEKKRQRERMAEIEKVKKMREGRALEKAQHEEEMALLARERARAEFQDWRKKEEQFHFDQSKVRSEIRVREGRSKPIDVLSQQLNGSDDFDIVMNEPYTVFKGLTVKQMEELRDDIKMHLDLDRATPTHIEYWDALLVVCDWELAEARKKDALDRARVRGEEPPAELLAEERGLHSTIETDVKNYLERQTYGELEAKQSRIESQMRSGTAKAVEFWEAVLKRIHIYKAKACLNEIHTKKLHEHLEQPFNEDEDNEGKMEQDVKMETDHSVQVEDVAADELDVQEAETYSPDLPDEDENDKYRPRKPKYINRVHTGYEWNKYNRTHYDHDNPPPKIVQGYKFDIFYPDLVDQIKAPTYTIEKDGNSSETCIIRFHGGPPYEDIAFRIFIKEWEYSYKNGFKCVEFCTSTSTLNDILIASNTRVEETRKNEAESLNPRRPILDVAPINSMPYIGPPLPHSYIPSSPRGEDPKAMVKTGPAMVYCPLVTGKKWDDIVSATKVGVALTGTAAMGKVGPVIGRVDIGEDENSYFFRVSLPGVARDQNSFSCDMEPDGKVKIKGVTTTGENIVCKHSQIFWMQSKNLCPPGHFSITLQLPGPVNNLQFSGSFGADGILEGTVAKR